jgi:hypothetical protein
VDAFHRSSEDVYNNALTDMFPGLGASAITVQTRTEEKLTGKGFGGHASFNVTEQLTLSLGGMGYSYDDDVQTSTDVSAAQRPLIAQFIENRLNTIRQQRINSLISSGVTRNVTPLDSSYNAGVSYLFGMASVSAQYVRDKILDSDSITNTYSLGASFFVGDHWILSPTIGESKSDTAGDVTFGGLSASYNW